MKNMNTELSNISAEINREHALAQQNANIAIEHGKRAGELLLQVKESLPHGSFGAWLSENVAVSDRQAQRYMRHAKGLPVLRSMKSDTVSVLEYNPESIAKIVADTVAKQLESEREKMRLEIENEIKNKELSELAKGINADYESFKQNRDGLIDDLFKMKSLHVGAYWLHLIELSKSESKAVEIFTDFSHESIRHLS
jgi:hypothetical protein